MCGFAFNAKFPPYDSDGLYHGYKTPAQECLFYDFAVQGYDLKIKYKGQSYYFMVDTECVWLSDENFTAKVQKFANGNDVLEHFCIEGTPLCKLVDCLDEYEPM
jgi:hypothetical protein